MNLEKINKDIIEAVHNGVQNSEIVSTIDLLGGYLNAKTIAAWAKEEGIDYTSAKYRIVKEKLQTFELFGVTFLIENE